jgi:hypothetical protein
MSAPTEVEVIQIPVTVWETADTKEDLEDWLLVNDPRFIAQMREIRKQDLDGEFEVFVPST